MLRTIAEFELYVVGLATVRLQHTQAGITLISNQIFLTQ